MVSLSGVREVLRNVAVFTPLSDEEIDSLAQGLAPREVGVGEHIVEEGDSGDSMSAIAAGIVVLSRHVGGETKEIAKTVYRR